MIDRVRTGILLTACALAAGACGENEVATAHIRAVVLGLEPGADSLGAGAPGEESRGGVSTTGDEPADHRSAPVVTLPNGDTMGIRASVVAFYRDRNFRPAWTDDDEILPRGLRMLEAIGEANTEGLDRERYHYSTAQRMARLLEEDAVEDRELEYLGNLDLLLTENFARLSQDLVAGTLDPAAAGLDWQIDRGEAPDRDLIEAVLEGRDPRQVLASLEPQVPYYTRMTRGLHRLREIEGRGGWGTVGDGPTVKPGDRDARVAQLRSRLSAGDDYEESRLAKVGGNDPERFDEDLQAALEHFQTRHALHEDGALGPKTLAALNVPVEKRIDAMRLNLDRWRWLPNDLGETYILVNVAGFELEVVDADSAIESMNVVVGKTANRTPIFRDTLEYMVVNPYWNVPKSIAVEEVAPKALEDPTYLARNGFELVWDGKPVSAASVSTEDLMTGRVRIRQQPGRGNALGHVKFLFPNHNNIYLHDTPADHLFTQETRAFSHGCIRVERPDDLARVLLRTLTDRAPSEYDRLRESDGEQWISFDRKIPVYILYFTAWVDEDGTIRFHPDIYDRDRSLEAQQREKMAPIEPRPIALSND